MRANIHFICLSPPMGSHAGLGEVNRISGSLMHVLIVEILATSKSERHYGFAWNDERIWATPTMRCDKNGIVPLAFKNPNFSERDASFTLQELVRMDQLEEMQQ